ncbi:hypothetical protein SAMN05421810_105332 [Amycolatopsis arida]|uniref:Uncharacterized protein n=1 Tax=Amycolatopsis arida TaxID=587909 RepID=A0A1I5WY23_9PSEU|nr:hypothetical protein [Amycolatopsis arida]TDX92506.1 hypothetical protein CLV69_105351 [Amycolatopsis arida]SFQ24548.1 hypothetical protein SAMN05421810_105332 [Amycolatopsis arida]
MPAERTRVVGLLADPGFATELADQLAAELPEVLDRRGGDGFRWRFEVVSEPLALDPDNNLRLVETARDWRPRRGWDLMVCLTDLPRRIGTRPVIADLDRRHGVALISLPGAGWLCARTRVREVLVMVLGELADVARLPALASGKGRLSSLRRVDSPTEGVDISLVLVGLRGRLRLMAGMVRDNRPWRLVPSLSTSLAAAAATGAFGVFYSTIWSMADALTVVRLAMVSVFAIAVMVTWIILHHGLWERGRPWREAALYNGVTVLTLLIGVACMYVVLFGLTALAAMVVIADDYLASQLRHPVGLGDYTRLAWLASSLGTVAGALGSSLESEDAVLAATYGVRERRRRVRRRAEEDRSG